MNTLDIWRFSWIGAKTNRKIETTDPFLKVYAEKNTTEHQTNPLRYDIVHSPTHPPESPARPAEQVSREEQTVDGTETQTLSECRYLTGLRDRSSGLEEEGAGQGESGQCRYPSTHNPSSTSNLLKRPVPRRRKHTSLTIADIRVAATRNEKSHDSTRSHTPKIQEPRAVSRPLVAKDYQRNDGDSWP